MPIDYSRYPENWHEFSRFIRFERAQNKCEWCGAMNGEPHPVTGSKVVLTVAHMDAPDGVCQCEKETGAKCAKAEHVAALCQRDHLTYDGKRHAFNARRTRASRAGQMWLGDMEKRYA
jgi:hypothetical protein